MLEFGWVHWEDAGYSAVTRFLSTSIWGKERKMPDGTVLCVFDGKRLIGAVLAHNYQPDCGVIEMTAAATSARWLSRPILFEMFDYAFNQVGCQAVVLRVSPNNMRLSRILTAYGFERRDIPRMRGRNEGEAIFVLGDDVWRENGFHKENARGKISA